MKGDHMSPANPGESVREQLAQRSTEKALANLNEESTEKQAPEQHRVEEREAA
jgi:hypothetical protein